jgi:low temperature requirement protein LtrA
MYAATITVAQVGWIAIAVVNTSVSVTFLLFAVMVAIEVSGPLLAEKRKGGTPWHAHHIAERNGLLTIIALGEGVVGTVASLSAMVAEHGWSAYAALVAVAGTGLTFGMWWVYFVVPGPARSRRLHPASLGDEFGGDCAGGRNPGRRVHRRCLRHLISC